MTTPPPTATPGLSAATTTARVLWWNLYNLFDDHDDTGVDDMVVTAEAYQAHLRHLAAIIAGHQPDAPDVVAFAENENARTAGDLATAIGAMDRRGPWMVQPAYAESRDPRGIDSGFLIRRHGPVEIISASASYPDDRDAVRPVVEVALRFTGTTDVIHVLAIHSKSRRDGPADRHDPTPGSRIRQSYGCLLRQRAAKLAHDGIPCIVLGDLNDEPEDWPLRSVAGADAIIGRPTAAAAEPGRLYNLTREAVAPGRGSIVHHGGWLAFDQVMASGLCFSTMSRLRIGTPHLLSYRPLRDDRGPNRDYSDHLPMLVPIHLAAPVESTP